MTSLKIDSHEFYVRALLDPSRSGSTSPETDLKIAEEIQKVQGFIPAITILNDHLEKEQAKVDPHLAASLCVHVSSRDDWKIQKRIYQAVRLQDSDSLLFKEMLLKSAEVEDRYFFVPFARHAVNEHSKNVEIMKALAISYVRIQDFKKGYFKVKELIEKHDVETPFVVTIIEALPTEQELTANNLYRLAIHRKMVSRDLHRAIQRFHPIDGAVDRFKLELGNDLLTAIDYGVLLEEAIRRQDIKLSRRIYHDAMQREQMNLILWERIIDFETRIAKNLKKAKKLFLKSPIEIELKEGRSGSELDLHGHSYGCAALMVETCILAFKTDVKLGDHLILVTGKGWEETKNYFEMQRYILEWIETHWKGQLKVQVNPENQGQLLISF